MFQFIVFFISVSLFCFAAAVAVELIRDYNEWRHWDEENEDVDDSEDDKKDTD